MSNKSHFLKKMPNILPVQALFLMSIHLEQSNFPSTKEGIWEVGKPRAASSFVNLLVNFLFCLQVRYHLEIHFVALISICSKSLYKMMFWKMSLVFILPSQNRAIFVVSKICTLYTALPKYILIQLCDVCNFYKSH